MKAVIRNIDKQYLPHNIDKDGKHMLHVVTQVDFVNDVGEVVLNQTYAHLPEHFEGAYFQRQADSMEGDIDYLKEREKVLAAQAVEEKPADDAIRKFKLEFADVIKLHDEVKQQ
jgi:hypothetical protein